MTSIDVIATIPHQAWRENATDTQKRQVRSERLPQGLAQEAGQFFGEHYANVLRRGVEERSDWYSDFEEGIISRSELKFREAKSLAQEAERNGDGLR